MKPATFAVALALAARAAHADGPAIDHSAVGCVVAGKHPKILARIAPASQVARARVYFRAEGAAAWHFVRMTLETPSFTGTLPKPKASARRIQYYIEAVDRSFGETRTIEISPEVVASENDCRNAVLAPFVDQAAVSVGAAAGAPALPLGFAAAAGAGTATVAVIVGGGVAVAGGVAAVVGDGGAGHGADAGSPPATPPVTVATNPPPSPLPAPPTPTPTPPAPTPMPSADVGPGSPSPTTSSPTPTPTPMATLTLTKVSLLNLTGRVFDNHGQIDCGLGCGNDSGTYPVGTTVVLTAQPGLLPFRSWSGACSGSQTTCTVVMTTNKSVTATFALLLTESAAMAPARWVSAIDAPDGGGRILVNGAVAGSAARGVTAVEIRETADGALRVEGVLDAASGPGTWRFERLAAGAAPVRLKVVEGQPALVGEHAIVFRLRGRPGERVSFAIVPAR